MNPVIYDLNYDFIQQHGHYMVFTEKNNRLIENDDLVPLQMKMIRSNAIPFFVPMSVEEMDFKIRLHYDITSKKMFSVYLKEKALSSTDFYSWFLRIIEVLEDSPLYLLDKNRYVLKEDFIFIGRDTQDIFLTYLPLKGISGKGTIEEELKELLTHVASQTDGLKGSEFKSILQYVDDPAFNLNDLKKLIVKLQTDQIPLDHLQDELTDHSKVPQAELQDFPEPQPQFIHEQEQEFFIPPQSISNSEELPENDFSEESNPTMSQREKIMIFAFAAILLASIWKLKTFLPSNYSMDLCSGLSILVLTVVYVYLKKWRPGYRKTIAESAATIEEEADGLEDYKHSMPLYPEVESTPLLWKDTPENQAPLLNNENYYEHLNENTTFLHQSDDTVMLSSEAHEAGFPYLIKKQNGETEKINLSNSTFVIGRNPEAVQLVLESANVSRTHLEINAMDHEYSIKDLGSKNGSLLNEQVLVPYKIYSLKDQDRIIIGDVQFSFQMGS